MASTLSNGYILPANPDTGDTFWANLATDIQLMNNHVHDGVTGNVLPVVTQTISAASWAAVSGQAGTYSQVVTVPTQFSFDSVNIAFKLSNGTQVYPTVTRVSSSQFTVFMNDNSQNLVAVYSS